MVKSKFYLKLKQKFKVFFLGPHFLSFLFVVFIIAFSHSHLKLVFRPYIQEKIYFLLQTTELQIFNFFNQQSYLSLKGFLSFLLLIVFVYLLPLFLKRLKRGIRSKKQGWLSVSSTYLGIMFFCIWFLSENIFGLRAKLELDERARADYVHVSLGDPSKWPYLWEKIDIQNKLEEIDENENRLYKLPFSIQLKDVVTKPQEVAQVVLFHNNLFEVNDAHPSKLIDQGTWKNLHPSSPVLYYKSFITPALGLYLSKVIESGSFKADLRVYEKKLERNPAMIKSVVVNEAGDMSFLVYKGGLFSLPGTSYFEVDEVITKGTTELDSVKIKYFESLESQQPQNFWLIQEGGRSAFSTEKFGFVLDSVQKRMRAVILLVATGWSGFFWLGTFFIALGILLEIYLLTPPALKRLTKNFDFKLWIAPISLIIISIGGLVLFAGAKDWNLLIAGGGITASILLLLKRKILTEIPLALFWIWILISVLESNAQWIDCLTIAWILAAGFGWSSRFKFLRFFKHWSLVRKITLTLITLLSTLVLLMEGNWGVKGISLFFCLGSLFFILKRDQLHRYLPEPARFEALFRIVWISTIFSYFAVSFYKEFFNQDFKFVDLSLQHMLINSNDGILPQTAIAFALLLSFWVYVHYRNRIRYHLYLATIILILVGIAR